MLKDLFAILLGERAEFAGGRERRRSFRRAGQVLVRLCPRVESESVSWRQDGHGRYQRRKGAFDFFDD
jgi:hypothetical protein